MKVMLDLNVLLDVIQKREPHFAASAEILALATRGKVKALVPSHCLTTLYFIIAKHADRPTAEKAVDWILSKLNIQPAIHSDYLRARTFGMKDFEDAVVAAISESSHCQTIITRNVTDFEKSPIPALTPEEFLVENGN
ncbi:MAG: PIN domain-containing protein [Desulfamplus sp.]|nr:PIN domain-containing protein [Desulfamplus sp.]